ncbi:MAG: hypothetical protein ACTS22_08640 [Phycisphaerales bacterium]
MMNKPDLGDLFETALKNKATVHVVIQGHPFTVAHLQAVRATGHNVTREEHESKWDKWLGIADAAPRGSLILVGGVISGGSTEIPGCLIIDPQSVDAVFIS